MPVTGKQIPLNFSLQCPICDRETAPTPNVILSKTGLSISAACPSCRAVTRAYIEAKVNVPIPCKPSSQWVHLIVQ